MPSFFGRKYLRGRPGPTERWIGFLVLGLTFGIIAIFLLTGGLFKDFVDGQPVLARVRQYFAISEQSLFTVDLQHLPQPAPPRPPRPKLTSPFAGSSVPPAPKTAAVVTPALKPGIARFADVPGGRLIAPTHVERYTDNMYEKINGKESGFRAFHVVDLRFGQYADPDNQQTFDVYVYDMAAPANAMGMFASERVDGAAALPVGREAYVSGSSVFFWKGPYYINVMGPPGTGENGREISQQIATAIAETIVDDGQPFWAEGVLPTKDRLANSLSYQATSALGYEFLERIYFARYAANGTTAQMYITKAADAAAADSMFTRFADSTAKYEQLLTRDKLEDGQMMVFESPRPGKPSRFGATFCKGPYFGGVAQCEDRQWAERQAKELFNLLSASDPGDPEAATAPSPMQPETSYDEGSGESGEEGAGEY